MARSTPTNALNGGEILAAAVHDRSGRLLIPAGMVLQGKHVRVLHAWGIATVEVVDDEEDQEALEVSAETPDESAALTPEIEARALAILAERFRHCDIQAHPMETIHRLAREALLDELRRKPSAREPA